MNNTDHWISSLVGRKVTRLKRNLGIDLVLFYFFYSDIYQAKLPTSQNYINIE